MKRELQTEMISMRVTKDLIKRAEKLAEQMSEPGRVTTRGEVLRLAAFRGIDQLEGEQKKSR